MAEHRLWQEVRLTFENLDGECPENHRTVALVHLDTGEVFEANLVRPDALTDTKWITIQSDHLETGVEVRFVQQRVISHVELKYVRTVPGEKRAVGFTVDG